MKRFQFASSGDIAASGCGIQSSEGLNVARRSQSTDGNASLYRKFDFLTRSSCIVVVALVVIGYNVLFDNIIGHLGCREHALVNEQVSKSLYCLHISNTDAYRKTVQPKH